MKIAVAGKGGSGKTTVAGTLARAFGASEYDVLAIDDDDDPNLDVALGVDKDAVTPIPDELVDRVETPEGEIPFELSTSTEALIADYGTEAPDGVTLLTAGAVEAGSGCFGMSHVAVRIVVSSVVEGTGDLTIVDLPNGLEHFGLATATDVDVLLVVVEPTYNSLETVGRSRELAAELDIPELRVVANKIRDDRDREIVEEYCADQELELAALIPYDDAIRHAERDGTAPIDAGVDGAAIDALASLADDFAQGLDQRHRRPDP